MKKLFTIILMGLFLATIGINGYAQIQTSTTITVDENDDSINKSTGNAYTAFSDTTAVADTIQRTQNTYTYPNATFRYWMSDDNLANSFFDNLFSSAKLFFIIPILLIVIFIGGPIVLIAFLINQL